MHPLPTLHRIATSCTCNRFFAAFCYFFLLSRPFQLSFAVRVLHSLSASLCACYFMQKRPDQVDKAMGSCNERTETRCECRKREQKQKETLQLRTCTGNNDDDPLMIGLMASLSASRCSGDSRSSPLPAASADNDNDDDEQAAEFTDVFCYPLREQEIIMCRSPFSPLAPQLESLSGMSPATNTHAYMTWETVRNTASLVHGSSSRCRKSVEKVFLFRHKDHAVVSIPNDAGTWIFPTLYRKADQTFATLSGYKNVSEARSDTDTFMSLSCFVVRFCTHAAGWVPVPIQWETCMLRRS